ncbi:hypothetical protein [Lewinella sp. 4G2]|uniref:hypothetical protein n=1 Tax=Lewinella sp. 4G2 TaxID=1803372 RepID=UPI0012F8ADA3|nr:hypothetical protein [Lewinella sp. 4G2]
MTRLNLLLALLLLPALSFAGSVFDLMNHTNGDEHLAATLKLPVDSIMARSEAAQQALFSFVDAAGLEQEFSVKITTRGKFRRNRCEMPPLKIDFKKKDLEKRGLAAYDKYKLVVPCFENELAEELILKEHLAYQIYQTLTPYSYRTQLLKLTIKDENGGANHVMTAFIIEATDEMAARNGGVEAPETRGLGADNYDQEAEATHAFFQYLVGNGDWSLLLRRNVKVIDVKGKLIPVGYDFDFTGFVGAPYATASTDTGQRSIYDRVYLGYAQNDEVIDRVSLTFKEKRREILKMIANVDIDADARSRTYRFATRFFARVNRLRSDEEFTLYDQLRGETAAFIPTGESPSHYQSMGR